MTKMDELLFQQPVHSIKYQFTLYTCSNVEDNLV
jgi:hypothetical protein